MVRTKLWSVFCEILHKGLREDSTEEMIFEKRPQIDTLEDGWAQLR